MTNASSRRIGTVADGGDDLAGVFAETRYQHLPGGRKKLEALLAVARAIEPRRVLDVGCGNGALTFPLAALGYDTVGTDLDPGSIEHCRAHNRFANARFVLGDGTLGEIDGSFDLIVCSEVLEHLADPGPLVAAMRAKLAPAGHLFVTIPNGYGLREIGGRVERWLRRRLGFERPLAALRRALSRHGMVSEREKYVTHTSNPEQDHVQFFTRGAIVGVLRRCGLEVNGWWNSFVLLSVFHTRSGLSLVEKLDSRAADHLPASFASGWFIDCVIAADRNAPR